VLGEYGVAAPVLGRPGPGRANGADAPGAEAAPGFRHNELLPEGKVLAVAERGPDTLTDAELTTLLLNPLALWDVADVINAMLPEYWLGRMNEVGRQLMEEYGLEVTIPGLPSDAPERKPKASGRRRRREREPALTRGRAGVEAGEGGAWNLLFRDEAAQALARRIAEHAYGDPDRAFTLRLYRLPVEGQPNLFQAEVGLSPAPTKNDLVLVVTFPAGGERTFTLEVPPEVKADPEAEPRERTRSEPSEPLPAEAFEFQGGGEWRDDAWPPSLVVRSHCRREALAPSPTLLCPSPKPLGDASMYTLASTAAMLTSCASVVRIPCSGRRLWEQVATERPGTVLTSVNI
jgi:hypothetical protein